MSDLFAARARGVCRRLWPAPWSSALITAGVGAALGALLLASCSSESAAPTRQGSVQSCAGVNLDPDPPRSTPERLPVLGVGLDTARYEAEIAVRGSIAYTTTWGTRRANGNAVHLWQVDDACPRLIDSVIVANATTTGDVAVSDDGTLLVVATEYVPGSIVVYSLADPVHPVRLSSFSNEQTAAGVHTASLGRVGGTLYAFLAVDPGLGLSARLVIVNLSNPAAPRQVYVKPAGKPFVHDTFARDGLLFVALWGDGLDIWDIGGGGRGGLPEHPVVLGNVRTIGGNAHNVWWYHAPDGSRRYAFVGEEGAGTVGSTSRGDIHVIDLGDFSNPREVAFFHVEGAGTHNFAVDEARGVLYAAYYNAGVRAIDIRGDLGSCASGQQSLDGGSGLVRCDLRAMGRELAVGLQELDRPVYVWGVELANGALFASDMLNGIWKLGLAR